MQTTNRIVPAIQAFIVAAVAASCFCVAGVSQQSPIKQRNLIIQQSDREVLFDPAHPKEVSYVDHAVRMHVVLRDKKLGLAVEQIRPHALDTVMLPAEMVQVNAIRSTPFEKVVVLGMANGDVWEIAIFDLKNRTISDKFVCYEPALSPDGRYIAFVKFFPPHSTEGAEDHYMVYDLSKDAAGNRPIGASTDNWNMAGFTVYPTGIGNREFDNLHHPESTTHAIASEGFFWSPSQEQFVFADAYQNQTYAIVVSISANGEATIKAAAVPRSFCPEVDDICTIRLVKVAFSQSNSSDLILTFAGRFHGSSERVLTLPQSKFSVLSRKLAASKTGETGDGKPGETGDRNL